MSSLSPKDRAPLCMFSYADGRRCRTPRVSSHPHFCYDHAQKEARAATADKLAKDLSAFFSGHHISASDLSTALARLLPAIVRGDIKPRVARTVAYMAQTLLQSINLAQSEFHDAFGPDNYRKAIRTGIVSNHDRLYPPEASATNSAQAQPSTAPAAKVGNNCTPTMAAPVSTQACHPERGEGSLPVPASSTAATISTLTTQPPTTELVEPHPKSALATPPPANPSRRPTTAHRDPYTVHFDHTHHLREPEKAY